VRDRREPPPGAGTAAQARLAAELDDSLSRTRMAWEAASLRGDAALRLGDRAEAVRALDEQRALLRDLHTQVDRALGRAVVAGEAETVVASVDRTRPSSADDAAPRRRAPAAAMTGAVLAAVLGLVTLVPSPPPAPEVGDLAADLPPSGAAGAEEGAAELPGAAAVEAAGGARSLASFRVAFDHVTDVLGELHDVLTGPDERPGPPAPEEVDTPHPADEGDTAEGGPVEAARPDDGEPDAPALRPLDGLPDALAPDPEDEGSDPEDPPGRLDLNGRLGGGGTDGASTIDGLVQRLDLR
jgi:hypothetical protein